MKFPLFAPASELPQSDTKTHLPILQQARSGTTSRYRQALLYGAFALILVELVIGIITSLWIGQVKDVGITFDWSGRLLSVQEGSYASQSGALVGDYISFEDFMRIRAFSGNSNTGDRLQVEVQRGDQQRNIVLEAQPGTTSQHLEMLVITWVGIGFVLVGIAPLVARRRNLALWLFFLATQLTGLYLIAEIPRSLSVRWAEILSYVTFPLWPAALFHFHSYFPQPKLGRWRPRLIALTYAIAAILIPLDLVALWDLTIYLSDWMALLIKAYMAIILVACLAMLVHTYVTTTDDRIRAQLKIITICSGFGLAANAILVVPALLFDLSISVWFQNIGVIAALSTPFGYAYAMLRYNLLIDGLLMRRWLLRAGYTSVLVIASLAILLGIMSNMPVTKGGSAAVWGLAAFIAVLVGVIIAISSDWIEARVFKSSNYVYLLNEATREFGNFQTLNEFISFFVGTLPGRLKSKGTLLFLGGKRGEPLQLQARSALPGLSAFDPKVSHLVPTGELSSFLRTAGGLISLAALRTPGSPTFSDSDEAFLNALFADSVEQLLPLVSNRHPRLIGLVALRGKETDDPYSAQELAALAALARTASASAENVLLFEEQQAQLVALQHEQEYRSALAIQLNNAQETERKRISRDLHDTALQELAVHIRAMSALREQLQDDLGECDDQIIEVEAAIARLEEAGQQPPVELLEQLERLNTWQRKLDMLLGEDLRIVAAPIALADSLGTNDSSTAILNRLALESQPNIEGLTTQAQLVERYIRDLCNDLHPTYLDRPLIETLRKSVERLAGQAPGIALLMTTNGVEPAELADNVKIAAKQIMEQAIHNAIQHAQPAHIQVAVDFSDREMLTMTVQDDGLGFSAQPVHKFRASGHHGLANMRERADIAGGSLEIVSAPEMGTCLIMRISVCPSEVSALEPGQVDPQVDLAVAPSKWPYFPQNASDVPNVSTITASPSAI